MPERPAPKRRAQAPAVAICMATHEPRLDLFERQVESIRAQDSEWTCTISDDCSAQERYRSMEGVLAGDERFEISRSGRRLGFYRNFERALAGVPRTATLVALADQDDRWHPDKLSTLAGAVDGAELSFSDARVLDPRGRVLSETFWSRRSPNRSSLASLAISNSVPGASALFSRRVLDRALPFPEAPGRPYHDHWIALVALALGEVAYVDRALYDYVQHPDAVLGHAATQRDLSGGLGARARRLLSRRERVLEGWERLYREEYERCQALALALRERCGAEMEPRKLAALERLIGVGDSAAGVAWLAARPLRAKVGRDETAGFELALLRGIAWRRLERLRGR